MGSGRCVLLAFLAGAFAGPVAVNEVSSRCATTCTDASKFKYVTGSFYEYTYDASAATRLEGSKDDVPVLQMKATVTIEVLSKCDFAMRLSDVSFSGELKTRLERSALRFAFKDGVIDTVCPSFVDDDEVLNMKKAVLSTLQSSMQTLNGQSIVEETDVAGECTTSYNVEKSLFGEYTIKKSKEFLGCRNRNGNVSSLYGQSFHFPSAVQSLPLTNGAQTCEQKISRSGFHVSSICKETHSLRPFNSQNSGASTEVITSLQFKSSTHKGRPNVKAYGPVEQRTNLLFKHSYGSDFPEAARQVSADILAQLCEQAKEDVRPETPELFSRLVQAARGLRYEHMIEIMNNAMTGRTCATTRASKFFIDAISTVGTSDSVKFMAEMILTDRVQGLEADAWLMQLAFIQQPTADIVRSLQPLLERDSLKTRSMLGISSIVHRICLAQPDCQQLQPVAAVVQAIERQLGSDCATSTEEERTAVMIALKAMGNAGLAAASGAALDKCASNAGLDADVTVAALDAFRRLPCTIERSAAMRIFQNAAEDAEVRIGAYLAIMACPDSSSLQKVKMVLSGSESVNQLTSFVWTHLANLEATANAFKPELRNILQDAKLQSDFREDVLKYSQNYEKSFFSEYLNIGGQVESNVVFSDKSYFPRSAVLNLTVDMFGSSVNLLEVGGRIQGAEAVLQRLFGKDGYFSLDYLKNLMNSKSEATDSLSKVLEKLLKINNDKVQGSIYLRTLGNEIFYKGADAQTLGQANLNIADLLGRLAQQKDYDLSHSSVLLDTTIIVPTAAGWPLNISVNAAATLNVQLGGKFDILHAAASPRNLEVSGHIRPSGAVKVTGTMGISAFTNRMTLQVISTLHSSTGLEGKILLRDGEVLSVEIKAPKDKMEVLNVESKVLMNGRELAAPEEGRAELSTCTSQMLGVLSGLELCTQMGSTKSKIVLNKVDTISAYVFEASHTVSKEGKRVGRISFDTPGSATNRNLLAELSVDAEKMAVEANLVSPWKKARAEASVANRPDSKQARIQVTLDGQQVYSALAEVGIDEKKTRSAYTPRLEIRVPGREPITISATLEANTKRPAYFQLTAENVFASPVTVTGYVNKDRSDGFNADLTLNSPWLNMKADGSLDNKKDAYGFRANLEYSKGAGSTMQRISTAGKFLDRSKGALTSYKGSLSFSTTHMPWLALSVEAEAQHTPDKVDAHFKLMHGEDKRTFLIKHSSTKRALAADWSSVDVSSRTSVDYAQNISVVIDSKYKHNSTDVAGSLDVQYAPSKTAKFGVTLTNRFAEGTVVASVIADLPMQSVALSSELNRVADKEYSHRLYAQWAKGSAIELTNTIRQLSESSFELTGVAKVPQMPVSYSGSLRMDPKDFGFKAEVLHMRNVYSAEVKGNVNSATDVSSSIKVTVPQRAVFAKADWKILKEQVEANFNIKWDADKDETKQVLLAAVYSASAVDAQMTYDASFVTACPQAKLSLTAGAKKSDSTAALTFGADFNDKKTELSLEIDATPGQPATGRVSLQSPYLQAIGGSSKYEAQFTHQGDEQVIRHNFIATWSGNQTVTALFTADTTSGFFVNADITTPFKGAEKFGINARVRGELANMIALDASSLAYLGDKNVSATISASKDRGQLRMLFPRGTVTAAYSHYFDGSKLKNEVALSWMSKEGSTREGTVRIVTNVGLSQGVVGTVSVSTPFYLREVSISFDHQGNAAQFTTQGGVSWNGQKVSATLKHSETEGKVMVVTPWRTVGASYQYSYGKSKLISGVELFWSVTEKVTAQLAFSSDDVVQGKLRFTSPFPHLLEFEGKFSHRGNSQDFDTSADLSWGSDKKIAAAVEFSKAGPLKGSFTLATPFIQFPSFSASFNHIGNIDLIRSDAAVRFADNEPITVSLEMSKANGFETKIMLKNIPSVRLNNLELTASRAAASGSQTTYLVKAKWNNENEISAQADATILATGIDIAIKVQTPFEKVSQVIGKISHNGDSQRFSTQVEASWSLKEKVSVAIEFNAATWACRLDARSPFGSVLVSHRGMKTAFSSNVKYTSADGLVTEADVEFSALAGFVGHATLKSPYDPVQSLAASFKHSGLSQDFSNSVEVSWGSGKTASLSTSFTTRLGVRAELKAVSPFGNAVATLAHSGDATSFKNNVALAFRQHKFSVDTDFSQVLGVRGSLSVSTTFEKFRSASVSFAHSGNNMLQFENSVQISWAPSNVVSFTSKFSSLSGLRGEAALTLPRYGTSKLSFAHDGSSSAFANQAEVSWGADKKVSIRSQFSSLAGVQGLIGFTSTFERLPQLGMRFNHKGLWDSFENYGEVTWWNDKKISLGTTFSKLTAVVASANFASPYRNVKASLTHRGVTARSFATGIVLSWSEVDSITAAVEFSNLKAVEGKFVLSSPFEPLRDFRAELKHAGDLQAFTNRMMVAWAADKQMTLDTNFAHAGGSSYKGGLLFVSPVRHIEGRLNHNGDLASGFASAAELEYGAGQKIAGNVIYSKEALQHRIAFNVSTPFPRVSSVKATAIHSSNADASSIENSVVVAWNNQKPLRVVSRFRNTGNKWQSAEFRQTLETPFVICESVSWSTSYLYLADKVEGRAEVSRNGETYQLDLLSKRDTKRARSVIEGSATVRTPFAEYKENQVAFTLTQVARTLTLSTKAYLGSDAAASRLNVFRKSNSADGTTSDAVSVQLTSPQLPSAQQLSLSYSLSDSGSYEADFGASLMNSTVGIKVRGVHKMPNIDELQHNGELSVTFDCAVASVRLNDVRQYKWSLEHSVAGGVCRGSISAESERKPERNMSFTWAGTRSTGQHVLEFALKAPYEALRDCSARGKVNLNGRRFDAQFTAERMQQIVAEIAAAYAWQDNLEASLSLKTPFNAARLASASMLLQNGVQPWRLQSNVKYNDKEASIDGSWSLVGDELDSSLRLVTPFDNFGSISAVLKNSRSGSTVSPFAYLTWGKDGQRIEVSATLNVEPPAHNLVLYVLTPFERFSSLYYKAATTWNLPYSVTYQWTVKTDAMTEALSLYAQYDRDSDNLVDVKISSPWMPLRSAHLSGKCSHANGLAASAGLTVNNEQIFQVNLNAKIESSRTNNGEVTVESSKWAQYIRMRIQNELDFSDKAMSSICEVEYARGKVVTLQYSHEQKPNGTIVFKLTSPFSQANFNYLLKYSKAKTSSDYLWREHTEFSCSALSFVSDTDFALRDGISLKHDLSANYKGSVYSSNTEISFYGSSQKFDAKAACRGSHFSGVNALLAWNAAPISLKATVNEYDYELSHGGDSNSFACVARASFPYRSQKEQISGTVLYSKVDSHGLNVTVNIQTPFAEFTGLKMATFANATKGFSRMTIEGTSTYNHNVSFDRAAAFKSTGEIRLDSYVPAMWNVSAQASDLAALAVLDLRHGYVLTSSAQINDNLGNITVRQSDNAGFSLTFEDSTKLIPNVEFSIHLADGSSKTYSLAKAYALATAA